MKISVFGLGYVGAVSAACFAKEGHHVIGVDIDQTKVDLIKRGEPTVIENDLGHIISDSVKKGFLDATIDGKHAVLNSDVSFVCVGTPSHPNGSLNVSYLEAVIREIATYIIEKEDYHIIVIRSTILPGTIEEKLYPILIKQLGIGREKGFGMVANPEFMREAKAVYDFFNPSRTVIGAKKDSDAEIIADLYRDIPAPIIKTSIKSAEMIKYADNIFHALKVTFSNEIGNICKALNIDSHEIMDIFCQDTKLNLSNYYLKPGYAFGGSCLPKDLRALLYKAKTLDVELPLLSSILPSNELQIENGVKRILEIGKKNIGVLGFAFKAETDDLRESPMVELIERLIGKGFDIKVFDRAVFVARLIGSNKEFIEKHIPHISELMVNDMNDILTHSEVIVIGNKSAEFENIFPHLKESQYVIDLVRIKERVETAAEYIGICW